MKVALEPRYIVETAERLRKRIGERFPESGLLRVAGAVEKTARAANREGAEAAKPILLLRLTAFALGALMAVGLVAAFVQVRLTGKVGNIAELLQGADAAANLCLLLGAGILSILKLEEKLRRGRALELVYALKAMAHVIDMHQLTKDPDSVAGKGPHTASSPKRTMTPFELGRYLDYCSELLSLIGKIAAVYARHAQDSVVLEAIDGTEALAAGLSRKIWQKIAILSETPASRH